MKLEIKSSSQLSPEQFKAIAKYKGWQYTQLASRWDVTPVWISALARNPNRPIRYDDALLGLPNKNRLRQELARRQRLAELAQGAFKPTPVRPKPLRPPVRVALGLRYRGYMSVGALVTSSEAVGSVAEEGMRGVVFEVQLTEHAQEERYGVLFETGLWDWFSPDDVDQCLVTNGLTDEGNTIYQYRDETSLQEDFNLGIFDFYPVGSSV
jgi:hypothetical protein